MNDEPSHIEAKKRALEKKKNPFVSSLVLNIEDQIAYFYGKPFEFLPQWASIDIELGELFIGGHDGEGRPVKLDEIVQKIYTRVHKHKEVLLVEVEDNDARKPKQAITVPLMIPTQRIEEDEGPPIAPNR